MTSLIQDLTSIVKEQKAKIAELMKSNEEATANIKVQNYGTLIAKSRVIHVFR